MKPYVGVAGIDQIEHARDAAEAMAAAFAGHPTHVPMLGYQVSLDTLAGLPSGNVRFPTIDVLVELLKASGGQVVTSLHYRTRGGERGTLGEQVQSLFQRDGIYRRGLCRAVQLNVRWPDPAQVAAMRRALPELEIILQLGSRALRIGTVDLTERLGRYRGLVEAALLDPSGGHGIRLDPRRLRAVYEIVRTTLPDALVGFAGGLGDEDVVERLREIGEAVGDLGFAIDAEGRLRFRADDGTDHFSPERARLYVERAAAFFGAPVEVTPAG